MQAAAGGQQPAQGSGTGTQAPFPVTQTAAGPQHDMGFGIAEGQPTTANPELNAMLDDFFKQ